MLVYRRVYRFQGGSLNNQTSFFIAQVAPTLLEASIKSSAKIIGKPVTERNSSDRSEACSMATRCGPRD